MINAMRKSVPSARLQREGRVQALGRRDGIAAFEQSARSGTVHSRYRMAKMPPMGRIIRVVP